MSLPLFPLLLLARKNRVTHTVLLALGDKAHSQWVWLVQGCTHYFGILELRASSSRPVVLSVVPGSQSASLGKFSVSGLELQTLWVEPPTLFCERPVFLILTFDNHSLCSIRYPNKRAVYLGGWEQQGTPWWHISDSSNFISLAQNEYSCLLGSSDIKETWVLG